MRRTAVALLMLLPLALAAGRHGARAAETYAINQNFGDIAFTVRHLGLFSSSGTFRRFTGQITLDPAHPENTRVAVDIATGSVAMNWAEAAAMLRSPPYFDVSRYPDARFTSTRIIPLARDRYDVEGNLELRGVTRPVTLHAALVGRHAAPEAGQEIADFVVTGILRRSAFGMTADQSFVSDGVDLRIDARVRLLALAHAN